MQKVLYNCSKFILGKYKSQNIYLSLDFTEKQASQCHRKPGVFDFLNGFCVASIHLGRYSTTTYHNSVYTITRITFSPTHTGSKLIFCEPGSATNPEGHSHLYDPTVLLHMRSERHAPDDWHSSISTRIKQVF